MTPQPTAPADRPPTAAPPADRPSGPPFPFPAPRREMTVEDADRWAGQFVAWSWDGQTILDGADSREELDRRLVRAGVDLERVVVDYMDRPGESYL